MADFNSKYTGEQVEALLDIVSQGGGGGGEGGGGTITEAEITAMGFTKNLGTITEVKMNGVSKGTSGVVDLGTVLTEHQDISGKVDKVTGKGLSTEDFTSALKTKLEGLSNYDDTKLSNALSTLREDFDTLATVATSGDYNDLKNKPVIPTMTSQLINDNGLVDEQTLSTALEDYTLNDEGYAVADGLRDSNDLIFYLPTAAPDDTDRMLLTNSSLKTINGESIVGSGDIEISGGGGEDIVVKELSGTFTLVFDTESGVLEPNKIYVVREKVYENIFISPNAVIAPTSDMGKYSILFTTGDDIVPIIVELPDTWLWANGTIPEIEMNVSYELSIVATKLEDDYIYKAVLTTFKSV